ncbi:hypothetical protein QMO39_32030, partial [Pseudomonas aeruginosa]|nr:hypothetical protein [Pseudomonas aeruginosa]
MDGAALAIGHPLGATGARITGKAAAVLRRTGGRQSLPPPGLAGRRGRGATPGAGVRPPAAAKGPGGGGGPGSVSHKP